ncbi:helix-turn-helix transcriptional regulator [Listeria innocua]|uniref:helix-turn-helix domain-containing protein n=1 Tax=Listeria innocua TaxID=1642 RepID=UPI00162A4EAE|nr:helix-turn-helix transcriptional regulator [Listeria innocua]MBC1353784.1 helix-turn-helix transcriptional regulator [Listeria innocua]
MHTGEKIKKRRKELGYNADYLASKLGVSRSTIFRYENGEIEKLPITILESLSSILKTTPAYLMGWHEDDTEIFIDNNLTNEELNLILRYRKITDRQKGEISGMINAFLLDEDKE